MNIFKQNGAKGLIRTECTDHNSPVRVIPILIILFLFLDSTAMPRYYIRKTIPTYTEDDLERAFELWKNGFNFK